ncbi:MAG: hypothetical protein LBS90_08850 [Oscillospiraceae bacterium]|jgi:hypothetical protein|nr:hypothetical protein [Oscillospiraceae bacterium]
MSEPTVNLELLPNDGDRALAELKSGKLVAARSARDFLYVILQSGEFHMFSHTVGAPGGGQRSFPENEKYAATVRKIAELADAVYSAEYDRDMNVYGVMSTAEDAILSMFPSEDGETHGTVEFRAWDRGKNKREAENGYAGDEEVPEPDDPFGSFNPNADK